jgi:diguanylate cyclase (GGDEF)-like protein/PAS domain S-box-containing protein
MNACPQLDDPDRLTIAQLNELSQREQVSAAVALPAILITVWVHWSQTPVANMVSWVIYMSVILAIRIGISRYNLDACKNPPQLTHWRNLRVFVTTAYGLGWGAMLFLFNTGRLDFLFVFKLAALAGVLGITVSSMSVVLPVYIGFIAPIFIAMIIFIGTNTPFLGTNVKLSFIAGVTTYFALLLVAARKSSTLTEDALKQRFEREAAEESLRASQERLRLILDSASEGIYGADTNGVCTFVNRSCLRLLGYEREEDLVGKVIHDLIHHTYPDGRPYPSERCHVRLSTQDGLATHIDDEVHWRADGSSFPVEYRSHPMYRNGKVVGVVVSFSDITGRKRMEEEVRQLAFFDPLTKLPNRRLLNDRLTQAMAASKRSGMYGALIFLDLDNFKPLNDQHGHAAGDLLLIAVAGRLKNCVREMDTVARFGGDEFIIILNDLGTGRAEAAEQASQVAEKVRSQLMSPFRLTIKHENGADTLVEHTCTASLGVVLFIDHEENQGDILRWADTAMYQAKDAGRNSIRFYEPVA